jgi:ethanolamine utilization protein EutQ (cupin superfamily)
MSVQHLTIDDTRTWFQASDRQVYIGDVLDLATSAATRVRFARYGKGAVHEWMVTVDETLIVTKGALLVRSEGSAQVARAGEVISLAKGTRVVYRGEEADTEVVFVSHTPALEHQRIASRPAVLEQERPVRGVTRLVPSFSVPAAEVRKGA